MSDDVFEDDNKHAKKQNKSRDLEVFSIRTIMKTENGRSFMWRCLQNCCTFENIYTNDALDHAYSSGKREHGVWLDKELREVATDDYFKMLKENYHG